MPTHPPPFLLILSLLLLPTYALPPPPLQHQFNEWKTLYSITYSSHAEEQHRFTIWSANFHRVSAHNERADAGNAPPSPRATTRPAHCHRRSSNNQRSHAGNAPPSPPLPRHQASPPFACA